jgi:nicotinamide riboside kinase
MDSLVLATSTKQQLEQFLTQPAHALLLVGPEGAGKTAIAQSLAADLLGSKVEMLYKHPYVNHVVPVKNTISIDTVRGLQTGLQLKTLGSKYPIRRIVIIEDAQALTTEAQNALLKSLEEPPADTVIIATVTNLTALLPTITSRAQHISVKMPLFERLQEYFSPSYAPAAIERAYRLSGGLPGLMTALLADDTSHVLVVAVENVKLWMRASAFERLVLVDQLAKQKEEIAILLTALERISMAALNQAADKQQLSAMKRWHHILELAGETHRSFERNAQPKLLLTHLMLEL